jgi:hypothetical protein
MKIDLARINRDDFDVKERDGRYLVNPAKSKHVWTDEELKFRSLLLDKDGNVISSGFPKFRNYGEDKIDDADFRVSLAHGAVTFREKMDGTLIIADFDDNGAIRLRTRGNFDLGDFSEPVLYLVENNRYFLGARFLLSERYSYLFEYTGPENRIVIRYEEPKLTYLGRVDKHTLELDLRAFDHYAALFQVEPAKAHLLTHDFDDLMRQIKAWDDKEGVVAEFSRADGSRRLLKIKATQYIKLHSIKFKLEGKVNKLAFLLGITNQDEAVEKLSAMGIDAEAQSYIKPELDAYLEKYRTTYLDWFAFRVACEAYAKEVEYEYDNERARRRAYVVEIQKFLRDSKDQSRVNQDWFGAAMDLYDNNPRDGWLKIMAKVIFEDSVNALRTLVNYPQTSLADMLTVPSSDD